MVEATSAAHFLPGSNIFVRNMDLANPIILDQEQGYFIKIPGRIGLSVKNMATFGKISDMGTGMVGGGGIGLAINDFTETLCLVTPSSNNFVHVIGKRSLIIQHMVEVFRCYLKKAGYTGCFVVRIIHADKFPSHCGLGSTSGAALGVLHGLNKCFGDIFTRN